MPRHGKNPMHLTRRLAAPAPLTMATVVHIPELQGYWSDSLEALKLCLTSLRASVEPPFELLVLDNGSCAEVRGWLEERFADREIDQLFLSRRNLGKVGAWNLLFAAAGGELVAYADSDVYFLPGWLEATRAVLDAYPEAGAVTAQAMSRDLALLCSATLEGAAADPETEWQEGEDLVPLQFVESHLRGLGETPESYAKRIPRRRDVRLRRHGVEAFASSAHFQFTSRREVLQSLFPLPTSVPFGDDNVFDKRLDDAGYWRLSTTGYFVHHMGNRPLVPDEELPWLDPSALHGAASPPLPASPRRRGRRILESRPVRRFLKAVHRKSYELLYLE